MGPFIEIVSYFLGGAVSNGLLGPKRSSPSSSDWDAPEFQHQDVTCWGQTKQRQVLWRLRRRLSRPLPLVVDRGQRRRSALRNSASALSSRLSCTRSRCSACQSEVQTGWSWICSCGRGTAAAAVPRSPSGRNRGWSRPAGGAPPHFSSSSQTPLGLWRKWFAMIFD